MIVTGKLVYTAITSLDGFTADEHGGIEWGAPDPEVFAFINEHERGIATYLYGRRMYESMVHWEMYEPDDDASHVRDFVAIWRAATKIVYSTTLETVSSARTRIARGFAPDGCVG